MSLDPSRTVSVRVSHDGHTALVQPVGDHDLATAHLLREALLEQLSAASLIVVDFCRTTFIDSTVLAVLVATHRSCRARGARVVAVNAAPNILRVLAITGVDELLRAPLSDGPVGVWCGSARVRSVRPPVQTSRVLRG